jgi:hypothetical protein
MPAVVVTEAGRPARFEDAMTMPVLVSVTVTVPVTVRVPE